MTIRNYVTQRMFYGHDKEWWHVIDYPKKCQHCGLLYDTGCVSAQNPTQFGSFLFMASRSWFCDACEDYRPLPGNEGERVK